MEKEQLQKSETEEMVSSYKQQIRDKEKEFKALKNSLNQERKAFLKEIKAEIRQVRKEERAKSLSPEEKEALKKKKAELISKKRKELLLPVYTQGEELMNAISHIVGGAFTLIATIVGIYFAAVSIFFSSCFEQSKTSGLYIKIAQSSGNDSDRCQISSGKLPSLACGQHAARKDRGRKIFQSLGSETH